MAFIEFYKISDPLLFSKFLDISKFSRILARLQIISYPVLISCRIVLTRIRLTNFSLLLSNSSFIAAWFLWGRHISKIDICWTRSNVCTGERHIFLHSLFIKGKIASKYGFSFLCSSRSMIWFCKSIYKCILPAQWSLICSRLSPWIIGWIILNWPWTCRCCLLILTFRVLHCCRFLIKFSIIFLEVWTWILMLLFHRK